jgi:hypothetical protein
MTRRLNLAVLIAPVFCLAACAAEPPQTASEQADASACTAEADAAYNAQNYDALSRTSQNGLLFAPTPNHVFDSQRMGSLHARDSQITECEQNGKTAGSIAGGTPIVTPQIIGQ